MKWLWFQIPQCDHQVTPALDEVSTLCAHIAHRYSPPLIRVAKVNIKNQLELLREKTEAAYSGSFFS
jgi:hypothetical protein